MIRLLETFGQRRFLDRFISAAANIHKLPVQKSEGNVMKNQNDKQEIIKADYFMGINRYYLNGLLFSVLILLLSGCQQSSSPNLNPCFSINAVAGMPSHETIHTDAFEDVAGRIRFKGTASGQIRLFLPVINNTGQLTDNVKWDRFKILYLDPDGNGDNYRVSAALQYLDANGNTPTIATLDSNDFANTGLNTMSSSFAHDFDFTNRYYYVEVKLLRKNTDANPWMGGLNICEQFQ